MSVRTIKQDRAAGAPLRAPDVLIHLHIPKTGGTSLNGMVQHGFPNDAVVDTMFDDSANYNGLGLAPYELCLKRFASCTPEQFRRIRYVTGHLPMGLHRAFDRPAKYFTIIRHPVDRVISDFYFRIQQSEPLLKDNRLLTLDEYVETRTDVYLCDYQVRVMSGSTELEAERQPIGMLTPGRPVETRHLEQAKRNIEDHFLSVATLENMTDLALLIRKIYGWPMRRLLNESKNRTKKRLSLLDVSPRIRKIIEECNTHDLELYEWVRGRFAAQRQLFEPSLSRDRQRFALLNHTLNVAGQVIPWSARKRIAQLVFYS